MSIGTWDRLRLDPKSRNIKLIFERTEIDNLLVLYNNVKMDNELLVYILLGGI